MTTTPLTARQASERLTRALLTHGWRTPCSDVAVQDYWISERESHRRQAAKWCVEWNCPVLAECLAAAIAHDEKWCVFGGRDFGARRPGRKPQRGSEAA